MPVQLRDIAAIAGLPGLYRIIKPTHAGVIIESLEAPHKRSVAQARQRVSILQEISIYTTGEEDTIPLTEAMENIRKKFGTQIPVTSKSSNAELVSFMEQAVPDFDQSRVYTSDIKKLVQWYTLLAANGLVTEGEPEAEKATESSKEEVTSES
jgi:hypothetical protein